LYPAPADQHGTLAIGGGDQGVDPQVHADRRTARWRSVGHCTDQAHTPEGQAHLHQPPEECHPRREAEAQRSGLPIWQEQDPIADTRILVGVGHIPIAPLVPRIPGHWIDHAQPRCCLHGLAELANNLLHALRGELWVAPLGPALPSGLAWPSPREPPYAEM